MFIIQMMITKKFTEALTSALIKKNITNSHMYMNFWSNHTFLLTNKNYIIKIIKLKIV